MWILPPELANCRLIVDQVFQQIRCHDQSFRNGVRCDKELSRQSVHNIIMSCTPQFVVPVVPIAQANIPVLCTVDILNPFLREYFSYCLASPDH